MGLTIGGTFMFLSHVVGQGSLTRSVASAAYCWISGRDRRCMERN